MVFLTMNCDRFPPRIKVYIEGQNLTVQSRTHDTRLCFGIEVNPLRFDVDLIIKDFHKLAYKHSRDYFSDDDIRLATYMIRDLRLEKDI